MVRLQHVVDVEAAGRHDEANEPLGGVVPAHTVRELLFQARARLGRRAAQGLPFLAAREDGGLELALVLVFGHFFAASLAQLAHQTQALAARLAHVHVLFHQNTPVFHGRSLGASDGKHIYGQ